MNTYHLWHKLFLGIGRFVRFHHPNDSIAKEYNQVLNYQCNQEQN